MCRGVSSKAPPAPKEDDPVYDSATKGETQAQFEMMMLAVTIEYKLFPPPDVTYEMAYRCWIVDSHKRTNKLLHRI